MNRALVGFKNRLGKSLFSSSSSRPPTSLSPPSFSFKPFYLSFFLLYLPINSTHPPTHLPPGRAQKVSLRSLGWDGQLTIDGITCIPFNFGVQGIVEVVSKDPPTHPPTHPPPIQPTLLPNPTHSSNSIQHTSFASLHPPTHPPTHRAPSQATPCARWISTPSLSYT